MICSINEMKAPFCFVSVLIRSSIRFIVSIMIRLDLIIKRAINVLTNVLIN